MTNSLLVLVFAVACAAGKDEPPDTGTQGEVVVEAFDCPEAAQALSYDEVSLEWGLIDTDDGNPSRMEGNPIALADFDGDGDDDIALGLRAGGLWLQLNHGDGLDTMQLSDTTQLATLAVGDLDGDGDLDLLGGGRSFVVLENDGAGGFEDTTESSGLEGFGPSTSTLRDASFADLDADGDLDLFLTYDPFGSPDGSARHRMLSNDGLGHFTDVSDQVAEESRTGLGWHTLLTDLDNDRDPDLFISNADQNQWGPNRLVRNDGPTDTGWNWTDVTEDCGCGNTFSAMGASPGDVDRDGLLDLYLTQSGPSVLLRNLGEGLFVDATAVFGAGSVAEPNHMTFGGLLFDHDHDGWLDVAATAGPLHGGEQGVDPTLQEQPNVLLAGGPEGFEDIATRMGFGDLGAGRGVAAGFLNEDAFLDLVVTHLEAPSRIYLSVCTDAPALVVELEGRASPSFGEGARVEVHAGEVVLIREISANPGWGAAMHPRAHFGLGDLSAERLVVYWPSGRTQEVALDLDGSARVRVVEAED